MFNKIKSFQEYAKQTGKQAGYWAYAAWTLPFLALSALVFEHFAGLENWYRISFVIIATTFFSISVFWWWWALAKIAGLVEGLNRVGDNVKIISDEIKEVKKELKQ
jgi:hypothetical protein